MERDAAIHVVYNLRHALDAAEDPGEVLLKYASENDLSLAQLQKLAQVTNTHLSLEQQGRDDRGATTKLVDTPSLSLKYTGVIPEPEKAAAYTSPVPTHDMDAVNLHFLLSRPVMEKKADAPSRPPQLPECLDARDIEDKLNYATAKLHADARSFYKLAGKDNTIDMEFIMGDAMYEIDPIAVRTCGRWFAKYASRAGLKVETFEGELSKRAFEFSTPESDRFADLSRDFLRVLMLQKQAAALGVAPRVSEDYMTPPDQQAQRAPQTAADEDSVMDGILGNLRRFSNATVNENQGAPPIQGEPRATPPAAPPGQGLPQQSSAPADSGTSSTGLASKLLRLGTAPAAAGHKVADGLKSLQDQVRRTLAQRSDEHRARDQMGTNMSVADIERSMAVRRMLTADPVLRQMDKTHVLNAYNTLAEFSPSLAQNPESMRIALRDAAAYGGLTPDTLHQYIKMRGDLAKAQNDETPKPAPAAPKPSFPKPKAPDSKKEPEKQKA